jgi:hypothetical protein
MSQRRAVNRTERRQLNQEMYLIRREVEQTPRLFTEDEVEIERITATCSAMRNMTAYAQLDCLRDLLAIFDPTVADKIGGIE